MGPGEVVHRVAACARILDAWPNARPMNRDRTLVEYVNATRGVPLGQLAGVIQAAIDAGGDFMPPAGEVLRRAVSHTIGGKPVGTDRDAHFWYEKRLAEGLQELRYATAGVAMLDPDRAIEANSRPLLGSGRT